MPQETPTFRFLPEHGNEKLYRLEERMAEAMLAVANHRKEKYGEALWTCAVPETVFVALDEYQKSSVKPAVLCWLRDLLFPEEHPRRFDPDIAFAGELRAMLDEFEAKHR